MKELRFWQRWRITPKVRLEWYSALASLSKEGLPLYETLKLMHAEFKRMGHVLCPLSELVLLGLRGEESKGNHALNFKASSFSKQEAPFTGRRTLGSELRAHVPVSEALLIETGDLSGRLHLGLESAAQLLSHRLGLYERVMKELARPLGYAVLMLALMVFLSFKILPEFERARPRELWPLEAIRLAWWCDHALGMALSLGLSAALVFGGLVWCLPQVTSTARAWLDRWVWPFQLYASYQGACFLLALSAFLQAGSGFTQAVQAIRQSSSRYMASQCQALLHSLKMGKTPQEALCELSMIRPEYHWLIVVYGLRADSPKAYERIAKEILKSVDRWLMMVLGYFLSHVMLLGVGAMVCWVYWAMFEIVEATPLPL